MVNRMLLQGLLLALFAGAAAGADPSALDKAKALVAKLDQDKDGRLSLIEYATGKLRELNGGNGGPYRLTPKSDAYLKGLDANKDGVITADEYAKGHVGDEFRAMDENRDGFVDVAELAAALGKYDRAQREGKLSSFIERYDLNRDGKVTRAEWPGSDAVFDRLDVNHDGVIDSKDAP